MSKGMKAPSGDRYSEVVARLQTVVEELEGGKLSLEESLEKFAEGVQLVKKGEQLLADAEKRIEQLLSEDGATRPLDAAAPPPARPAAKMPSRPEPEDFGPPPPEADDDIPF